MSLQAGQTDVRADSHFQDEPLEFSILGNEREPCIDRIDWCVNANGFATHFDAAGNGWIDSKQNLQHFGSTGSDQTGNADDLPRTDGEVQFVTWVCWSHQVLHLQSNVARRVWFSDVELRNVAANHQLNHAVVIDLVATQIARVFSIAENGNSISQLFDFSQTVRNVNNADAFAAKIFHDFEKCLGFVSGKAGRWLVHDQNTGVDRECSRDFDKLLLTDRQSLDNRVRRHIQADSRQ